VFLAPRKTVNSIEIVLGGGQLCRRWWFRNSNL